MSAAASSSSSKSGKRKGAGRGKKRTKKDENIPIIPHIAEEFLPEWMKKERTKILTSPDVIMPASKRVGEDDNDVNDSNGCVLYWMQRDMRTVDNWALLLAENYAKDLHVPLHVVVVLPPSPQPSPTASAASSVIESLPPKVVDMRMTERHGSFLLGGLKVVDQELREKNVPFEILQPPNCSHIGSSIQHLAKERGALTVVCDFSPLRRYREWMEDQAAPLLKDSGVPLYQVDAHNVVPVWYASPKREVGARTLRPKINKLLPEFMTHFPKFEGNSHLLEDSNISSQISWDECEKFLDLDKTVPTLDCFQPGANAAMERFNEFCACPAGQGLKNFDSLRNDPNYNKVCSNLSPWVNYGHISFQRLALVVRSNKNFPEGTAAFIEEGIVRRELSDNFVYYSRENYDDLKGAAGWAQESLELHSSDKREYLYSLQDFEEGKTHDDLWNAAQVQLVREGKMHGFLRMYWAKKILEWTESPAIALRTGLYLNDRYSLDGNDPNGFVGVGWSVAGIHDMGWKEREIFGKIRYMNYAGCKRKFKVDTFVAKYKDGMKKKNKSSNDSSKMKGTETKKNNKKRKLAAMKTA